MSVAPAVCNCEESKSENAILIPFVISFKSDMRWSLLRRKYFLNADLVDQMLAAQVC